AALLHRGVQSAHTTVPIGGWDSIRVDERRIWVGVREVLHAVVADALGELEGRLLLLGAPLVAREPRWLQVLTHADCLRARRAVRVQRRAVRYRIDCQLARRVRVRELPDAVGAHALGELRRLLTSGGGAVGSAAAGARN